MVWKTIRSSATPSAANSAMTFLRKVAVPPSGRMNAKRALGVPAVTEFALPPGKEKTDAQAAAQ